MIEEDIYALEERIDKTERTLEFLLEKLPKEYTIFTRRRYSTTSHHHGQFFDDRLQGEIWLEEQMTPKKKSFKTKSELHSFKIDEVEIREVPKGYYQYVH